MSKEEKEEKTLGVFDCIYFGSALHVIYVMIICLGESVNQSFVNDKTNMNIVCDLVIIDTS